MENERDIGGRKDPFDIFGGHGTFGGFTSSIFGRNPFDDPFFARPFGRKNVQATPLNEPSSVPIPQSPIIHELNSDDEMEGEEENEGSNDDNNGARINKEPFVDHPDDEPDTGNSEHVSHRKDFDKTEGTRAQSFQFHSCKVTYGGVDGAYYTSSTTRRMGEDGALMEECKEADKTTGEAKHRISKGVRDKGHSLTRKLNSDGKVETEQTLHNLNEDELKIFENSWRGNAGRYLPLGSSDSSASRTRAGFGGGGMSDWIGLLPSSSQRVRGADLGHEEADSFNRAQPKKVVRINIE